MLPGGQVASRWLALVLVLGGVKGESFMDFLRSRRDLTQVRLLYSPLYAC